MKYSIVGFNESTAEISVLVADFPLITIKLPVDEEGNVPEGPELEGYINGFLPHGHFQRQELIAKGLKNIDSVKALVDKDVEKTAGEDPLVFAELTNAQLIVLAISERDNRLRGCDWTQLPDVQAIHDEAWVTAWRKYRAELRDFPNTITDPQSVKFPIPPTV